MFKKLILCLFLLSPGLAQAAGYNWSNTSELIMINNTTDWYIDVLPNQTQQLIRMFNNTDDLDLKQELGVNNSATINLIAENSTTGRVNLSASMIANQSQQLIRVFEGVTSKGVTGEIGVNNTTDIKWIVANSTDDDRANFTAFIIDNSSIQNITVMNNSQDGLVHGQLNFIQGRNVTLVVADDTTSNQVNITINSEGDGAGAATANSSQQLIRVIGNGTSGVNSELEFMNSSQITWELSNNTALNRVRVTGVVVNSAVQTPWESDIDGFGYNLTNVYKLTINGSLDSKITFNNTGVINGSVANFINSSLNFSAPFFFGNGSKLGGIPNNATVNAKGVANYSFGANNFVGTGYFNTTGIVNGTYINNHSIQLINFLNNSVAVGTNAQVDFFEGDNVTILAENDTTGQKVNVTISSTGSTPAANSSQQLIKVFEGDTAKGVQSEISLWNSSYITWLVGNETEIDRVKVTGIIVANSTQQKMRLYYDGDVDYNLKQELGFNNTTTVYFEMANGTTGRTNITASVLPNTTQQLVRELIGGTVIGVHRAISFNNTTTINWTGGNATPSVNIEGHVLPNTTNQNITVMNNSLNGLVHGQINFIQGRNITLAVADDTTSKQVNITINSEGDGAGGGGSAKWSADLPVQSAKITGGDITQGAAIDAGERNWRLLFDDSTDEQAAWQGVAYNYTGGTINVDIYYSMASTQVDDTEVNATIWECRFMALTANDTTNATTDSFSATKWATGTLVTDQAADYLKTATATFTQAEADGIDNLDYYRFVLSRNADWASDNATGDAEVLRIHVYEP